MSPSSESSCPHSLGRSVLFVLSHLVLPNLCSEDVGECQARRLPPRLSTRITRNQVVRGIRVLATKSFEGEEINKESIP